MEGDDVIPCLTVSADAFRKSPLLLNARDYEFWIFPRTDLLYVRRRN